MIFSMFLVAAIASAETISEVRRPLQPDGLSGITRTDDGRYLAVDDSDGRLVEVKAAIDGKTGKIESVVVTNEIRLAGVTDGEGVAYDPLRKTVWVADEKGRHNISEHDPKSGKRLSEVKMPPHFSRVRLDIGIESLAISPDGLTMWTATEEAVEGDGGKATKTSGTVVRLQRYSRKSGKDAWKAAGQFAYVVDPMGGEPIHRFSRSGLSDLCVLPGGQLVALERELSTKIFLPTFRLRLYRVDLKDATDVSAVERLEGRRFTAVGKSLLLDSDTGFAMYEGVCLGPKLADGSQTLILISDGDGNAIETLLSVKLLPSETR